MKSGNKRISLILKLIVILSAAGGVCMSAYGGRDAFMGGSRVFMYFTIQTNIAIALICAYGSYMILQDKAIGEAWRIIKFVGTVSITLTGVVFTFVLAPTLGADAWNIPNTLTHVIVPVAAVLDFFVSGTGAGIKKRDVLFVTIPPILYAIYAGIGYALGWEFAEGYNYPYFFLNWGSPAGAFGFCDELPYMGSVWWILILLIFLIIVAYVYLLISDKLSKKG